jgi:RNA exonuclease 1
VYYNFSTQKSRPIHFGDKCLTEDGKELARACIIDYHSGKVVYDQLVKPGKSVIDYLTRWSGITAEALGPITTTFAEVQAKFLEFLSETPTPVLAGHSLESDLKALKICHPRCIDTAVIYHHPRGRPLKPGLAWLTKKWCGREIQNRGEGGHDPEEDARACLDLVRKKVENGPGFGEFKTDQESIFERMSRSTRNGSPRSAVVDHGTPASWHGSRATATVACKTDKEVLDGLLDVIPANNFIFGRFTELADASGCALFHIRDWK